MPESKTRKTAVEKRKQAAKSAVAEAKRTNKAAAPGNRSWVLPTFITVGLIGVVWLVVYYITASLGIYVPYLSPLGGWNIIIGMGAMAAAFVIATAWK